MENTSPLNEIQYQASLSYKDTRKEVAKKFKILERKLRAAQEIKKVDSKLSGMVRGSEIALVEAKKISVLPAPSRPMARDCIRPPIVARQL